MNKTHTQPYSASRSKSVKFAEQLFRGVMRVCGWLTVAVVISIFAYLIVQSFQLFSSGSIKSEQTVVDPDSVWMQLSDKGGYYFVKTAEKLLLRIVSEQVAQAETFEVLAFSKQAHVVKKDQYLYVIDAGKLQIFSLDLGDEALWPTRKNLNAQPLIQLPLSFTPNQVEQIIAANNIQLLLQDKTQFMTVSLTRKSSLFSKGKFQEQSRSGLQSKQGLFSQTGLEFTDDSKLQFGKNFSQLLLQSDQYVKLVGMQNVTISDLAAKDVAAKDVAAKDVATNLVWDYEAVNAQLINDVVWSKNRSSLYLAQGEKLLKFANSDLGLRFVDSYQFDEQVRGIYPFTEGRLLALVLDDSITLFNSTSAKHVAEHDLASAANVTDIFITTNASRLLVQFTDAAPELFAVAPKHHEASLRSLFLPITYDGYQQAKFLWQSSAATSSAEPKFSLIPLIWGTLKATFYAMLFGVPIALIAALYVSVRASPRLRSQIKPTIEFIEALPTVVIGMFAGLWLAPYIEQSLFFCMLLFVSLIPSVVILHLVWEKFATTRIKNLFEGKELIVLIPWTVMVVMLVALSADGIEALLFANGFKFWITEYLGLDYDQRNALIVGIAMGFAIIPTVFSIAEDALSALPNHIFISASALGSGAWQTIFRVMIPAAAPGMFVACTMGMGRAVGETMIVLVASGNTSVINLNIFEGMRTLSANIAIEMPESALQSSHYRILILSAVCLVFFTSLLNGVSEFVRNRMRKTYSLC